MIHLSAVSIWTPNAKLILASTTETFLPKERIGILAPAGSGKTTLVRVLAGLNPPQKGKIVRNVPSGTILGQENLLHPTQRIQSAVEIAAELLQLDPKRASERAIKFCGITSEERVSDLSPVKRSALAFALSIQISSAWLFADDRVIPNDPALQLKADAAIESRLRNSGLIFVSKNATQIGKYCDRFFVLSKSQLIPVQTLREAHRLYSLSLENT